MSFKTFEVKIGKQVRAFVNGTVKVFQAGEQFVAHEIGVGEAWVEKHLGHGVKTIPAPAAVENVPSAPVVVDSATGAILTAPAPESVSVEGKVTADGQADEPEAEAQAPGVTYAGT